MHVMSNYEYIQLSYAKDLNRIQVPKFQRGLVWTEAKKHALIETLHREFPIGVLLVAPDPTQPVSSHDGALQLLDGQQRLATIREYSANKSSYWTKLNPELVKEILNKLNEIIGDRGPEVTEMQLTEMLDTNYDLADWTDELDKLEKPELKELREIVKKEGQKACENYVNLSTLQLPVIKFLGEPNDLPQVFENLNQGGTPLTKYEVFNAAWVNHMITLPTESEVGNEILKAVKDYYIHMQENGQFDVSGFSEDELTSSREVNMAEFARALGTYVVRGIPSLLTNSQIDEIGFGLLGIIAKVDNKKIAELPAHVSEIQKGLASVLDGQVQKITKSLQAVFSKLTEQRLSFSKKSNAKKVEYSTSLSSSFKILSYFSNLWDVDETTFQKILQNLPSYYVYDVLTNAWTAHGDQRLTDYYPKIRNRTYESKIDKDKFQQAFKSWLEDKPRIQRSFNKDIKALITMHANLTYLSGDVPNGMDFEYEHIIPKNRILSADSKPSIIHCGALGNGMLLPKSDNNQKKDKTLYEAGIADRYASVIGQSEYPSEKDFNQIFNNLDSKDFDAVNKQIDKRSISVANTLIDGLLVV